MFYRLTPREALALPGPEYLSLAYRTPAYRGAMAAKAAEQEEEEGGGRPSERSDVTWVDGSIESLQNNPAFAGMVSIGRADGNGV